jgi:hypothetical protein
MRNKNKNNRSGLALLESTLRNSISESEDASLDVDLSEAKPNPEIVKINKALAPVYRNYKDIINDKSIEAYADQGTNEASITISIWEDHEDNEDEYTSFDELMTSDLVYDVESALKKLGYRDVDSENERYRGGSYDGELYFNFTLKSVVESDDSEDMLEMDSHEDDEGEDLEESRKLRSENTRLQKKLMRVQFARALQESLSRLPESHHSRFVSSLPPANSFKTVESFKTALVVAESAYRKGAAATISESKNRQPKTQNQAQAPKAISGKQGQRVTDPFGILGEGINMFEMMNKY